MRIKRCKPGDFIRIDLDGKWAYGRVFENVVGFYNLLSQQEDDLSFISHQDFLFKLPVMRNALDGKTWPVIGHNPIAQYEEEPVEFLSVRTNTDNAEYFGTISGSDCYPISYEKAKTLELLAVYEPEHIVERLIDHFEGRKNPTAEMFRLVR